MGLPEGVDKGLEVDVEAIEAVGVDEGDVVVVVTGVDVEMGGDGEEVEFWIA